MIKSKIEEFDAFQDYPWMFLYKEIDNWYPDAKFIMTTRSAEEVAQSDINMLKKYKSELPDKQPYIDRYNKHYNAVVEYFANKDNLLIINLSDGNNWEKICDFLKLPIPKKDFPHKNKGNYGKEFFLKKIIRKIKKKLRKKK